MTVDGSRFILYGAFPSRGNPCYRTKKYLKSGRTKQVIDLNQYNSTASPSTTPNNGEESGVVPPRTTTKERRRLQKKQMAEHFDNRFYEYTCMPPFNELEYSLSIDLEHLIGDLHTQPMDIDIVEPSLVEIYNDPLLKQYVGCDGSWPMKKEGPKSTDADAVSLSTLYEIGQAAEDSKENVETEVLMKYARRRVRKRRREGVDVYHQDDLLLGATLAIQCKCQGFYRGFQTWKLISNVECPSKNIHIDDFFSFLSLPPSLPPSNHVGLEHQSNATDVLTLTMNLPMGGLPSKKKRRKYLTLQQKRDVLEQKRKLQKEEQARKMEQQRLIDVQRPSLKTLRTQKECKSFWSKSLKSERYAMVPKLTKEMPRASDDFLYADVIEKHFQTTPAARDSPVAVVAAPVVAPVVAAPVVATPVVAAPVINTKLFRAATTTTATSTPRMPVTPITASSPKIGNSQPSQRSSPQKEMDSGRRTPETDEGEEDDHRHDLQPIPPTRKVSSRNNGLVSKNVAKNMQRSKRRTRSSPEPVPVPPTY
jgi:hypothetical protein